MNTLMERRKEKNISLQELSQSTGISERYLRFLEKGERTPSMKTAGSIANALNTSIDDLFNN